MLLYIHGPDTFRSRQYLKQSINQFKTTRDPHGYNVVVLDGKKPEPGKIFSELTAAPFMAEKRMVVIENILSSSDKELLKALIDKITAKTIPESTVAIFWQGETLSKVKEAGELQKLLAKEKYAREFMPLTGAKLTEWIAAQVSERSGTIEPTATTHLAQHAGHDMWHLTSLIDQLVAYASDPSPQPLPPGEEASRSPLLTGEDRVRSRPITIADIQIFLDEKLDDNVFTMVEAIVNGSHKQAYKLLYHQRDLGEDEGKLFGLLVWQFRILLEMADALERDPSLTSDTLAKTIGIHPFVAKKNMGVVRRTPLSKLQAIHRELLDIDIKTKTGAAPQDLLIDVLVGKV